jgi:hypothetical protein
MRKGWTGRVQKLSFKSTRKIGVESLSSNIVHGQLVTILSDTADVAALNERNRLDKTSRIREVLSKDCIRITSIEVIDVHPAHETSISFRTTKPSSRSIACHIHVSDSTFLEDLTTVASIGSQAGLISVAAWD